MQTRMESAYYDQSEESVTDKVVYLLGAGFSAPLGLPVMSNFLLKSKDLYFSDRERFNTFPEVFDTIAEMSYTKNYYEANLLNIEEILSILEMRELVGSGKLKSGFVNYILGVIEASTPPVQDLVGDLPGNWHGFLFTGGNLQSEYGYFVGGLFGLHFQMLPDYAGRLSRPFFRSCRPPLPHTRS